MITRLTFLKRAAAAVAAVGITPVAVAKILESIPAIASKPAASCGWGSTRITYYLMDGRWYTGTEKGYKKLSARKQRELFKTRAQWNADRAAGKQIPFERNLILL